MGALNFDLSQSHGAPSTNGASSSSSASTGIGSQFPLDSLKSKLVTLKSELSSKDALISSLRSQLSQNELERISLQSQHDSTLAIQKRDYDTLLHSNQEFSKRVLEEKGVLQQRYENLSETSSKLQEELQQRMDVFQRDTLQQELSKAKSSWVASEKLTRERYLSEQVRQIRFEARKDWEKEVEGVMEKMKGKMNEQGEVLKKKHEQTVGDIRSDHERLISTIRKQHSLDLERTREEERLERQKKIRETVEKYDKLMMEQRERYQMELETMRSQLTQSSNMNQNAIDEALLEQRKSHLFEIGQLKDQHTQLLNDLQRRHGLQSSTEKERLEIEKETWSSMIVSKLQKDFNDKERQVKLQLQKEQQEEIEVIVEKLTKENELACKEIVREYEKKIDNLRRSAHKKHTHTHIGAKRTETTHSPLAPIGFG